MSENLLVIDVGTSSVRAGVVDATGTVRHVHQIPSLPSTPLSGMVEFDASSIAEKVLEVANASLNAHGPVAAVGITNQRATTVVWDARTGDPIGPAIGWQDLRTVIDCLVLQAEGLRLAPNVSATKLKWLLDTFDPHRENAEYLRFGTLDTWVAWTLSRGDVHVTDASNAGVTGLVTPAIDGWDPRALEVLNVPSLMLPEIVSSSGIVGEATALAGSPPIAALVGDQQASLVGQSCTLPGLAKITFGTGGMLDLVTGAAAPPAAERGPSGTFPIAGWRREGTTTWGLEAIMLSAGSCVEWLRDDLGILSDAATSAEVAGQCESSEGVVFVPALLGLGTPVWDFGARGLLLGLTRGSGRAQITRAVLEGIAQRGRDLVDAAEADSGLQISSVRVDGGMSANPVFMTALSEALNRSVERSDVLEATTRGAGYLAGLATGLWSDEAELASLWSPAEILEPSADSTLRTATRERYLDARSRAERTIPDLSSVSF